MESSGSRRRSGRSGRCEGKGVERRKKVVLELKKVAAEVEGWSRSKSSVVSSGRSAWSGRSLEKVVEGREKVVVEKVAAEEEGWIAVKGRSERRRRSDVSSVLSKESSVLSEEEFPPLEKKKVKVSKEMEREKVWKEICEQKKRERKERKEKGRGRRGGSPVSCRYIPQILLRCAPTDTTHTHTQM